MTCTKHSCQSSRMHQYTRRQEVNKMRLNQTFTQLLKIEEYNFSKQWLSETIFGAFLWPVESLPVQARYSKNLKNALFRWACPPLYSNCRRYFIKYSLIWEKQTDWWSRTGCSLGNAIYIPRRWSHSKVRVNGRQIL